MNPRTSSKLFDSVSGSYHRRRCLSAIGGLLSPRRPALLNCPVESSTFDSAFCTTVRIVVFLYLPMLLSLFLSLSLSLSLISTFLLHIPSLPVSLFLNISDYFLSLYHSARTILPSLTLPESIRPCSGRHSPKCSPARIVYFCRRRQQSKVCFQTNKDRLPDNRSLCDLPSDNHFSQYGSTMDDLRPQATEAIWTFGSGLRLNG